VVFVADVLDYEMESGFEGLPRDRKNFSPLVGIMTNSLQLITITPLEPEETLTTVYECSTTENNQINSAASQQKPMINNAVQRINEGDSATFTEWFGEYTNERWNTVRDGINSIADNSVVAYKCDDRTGVYAYVYPTDSSHTIYCCKVFWNIPVVGGFDTKAGTLIHELSHFNNIAATRDWVYGTPGARDLARSNPTRAVNNADNYEYFSESLWN